MAACLSVFWTLSPVSGGPGITCDELYHVAKGKRLVWAWRQQGLAFFRPENIERNFPWQPGSPPMHPPLGQWVLGWTQHLVDPAPDDPRAASIAAARLAPPLAFGLLILLVGLSTSVAEGPLAGTVASAAVALVPRMFGHAHLASLETFTALSFVAAILALIEAVRRGGRTWQFALAGIVWGLAMLTRFHGVLIAPVALVWMAWHLRRRAWIVAPVWAAAGLATLLIGWQWLWLAPVERLGQFFRATTQRQPLHVFYLGQVWLDQDVPRHYAWVMTAVTLPLGLLLLGLIGIWVVRKRLVGDPRLSLVAGNLLFVLLVFSLPGTPVYDGVRLFLMVFPLWAVLAASGAKWLAERLALTRPPDVPAALGSTSSRRFAWAAFVLFMALQGVGLWIYHPCQLSHYSLLVGGLAGAEKLGFEVTYWGDTVREPLLAEAAELAPGKEVLYGPHLAPWQAAAVESESPALLENRVRLVGWDSSRAADTAGIHYAIVYHRKADLAQVRRVVQDGKMIAEYQLQGVWLARLYEMPSAPRP
ncbi:MAG: ArnT family glycosyltransferase [Pirellulales bacterium]